MTDWQYIMDNPDFIIAVESVLKQKLGFDENWGYVLLDLVFEVEPFVMQLLPWIESWDEWAFWQHTFRQLFEYPVDIDC